MSNVAATQGRATSGRLTYAAIGFALASVVVWVLAGVVDDALYTVTGILGIVAFGLGFKARREDRQSGSRGRLPLAAMLVGGFLGAAVIAFSVAYGISQLV
ncbi:MAG: hypothetical protein ACRDPV_08080 [Gaiellaceae bacterium]